jgi:hypothetical protein
MDLEELLEVFESQVDDESIFLRVNSDIPEIFLEFRKQNGPLLSSNDEQFLIDILHDDEKKWFATHILEGIERFGEPLMKELVQTAVRVRDRSLSDDFILPCLRVYDVFPVTDLLIGHLLNGSIGEKRRAASALYYARPTLRWKQSRSFFRSKSILHAFRYDFNKEKMTWSDLGAEPEMSPTDLESYLPLVSAMKFKREKALLKAFFENEDKDLLYNIGLALPKKAIDFTAELQDEAQRYFESPHRPIYPS